jgi:DNA-binding IclR family transcriptional regulator
MKVDRTLRVLDELAARPTPAGIVELAEALDEPPASLHRTLQVLVDYHLAVQDADSKRYRLGPRVLSLADSFRDQNKLAVVAEPILNGLRSELNESVFLCELIDDVAIVVSVVESARPLRSFMRLGHRMPFHAAASAKAILAYQDPERVQALLATEGLERYTSRTAMDAQRLVSELEQVRRRGHADCDEEMEIGVRAVACPIRDSLGQVIASVAVIAPRERLAGERKRVVSRALEEAAARMSACLGYALPKVRRRNAAKPLALVPAGVAAADCRLDVAVAAEGGAEA